MLPAAFDQPPTRCEKHFDAGAGFQRQLAIRPEDEARQRQSVGVQADTAVAGGVAVVVDGEEARGIGQRRQGDRVAGRRAAVLGAGEGHDRTGIGTGRQSQPVTAALDDRRRLAIDGHADAGVVQTAAVQGDEAGIQRVLETDPVTGQWRIGIQRDVARDGDTGIRHAEAQAVLALAVRRELGHRAVGIAEHAVAAIGYGEQGPVERQRIGIRVAARTGVEQQRRAGQCRGRRSQIDRRCRVAEVDDPGAGSRRGAEQGAEDDDVVEVYAAAAVEVCRQVGAVDRRAQQAEVCKVDEAGVVEVGVAAVAGTVGIVVALLRVRVMDAVVAGIVDAIAITVAGYRWRQGRWTDSFCRAKRKDAQQEKQDQKSCRAVHGLRRRPPSSLAGHRAG